jgi:hypothetical protein
MALSKYRCARFGLAVALLAFVGADSAYWEQCAPQPRDREREEISRGIAVHRSARSMAGLLGRSPSTVSREISRNGGYDGYGRRWLTRMPGNEPAARNAVSWRPIPGCDRRWPAS